MCSSSSSIIYLLCYLQVQYVLSSSQDNLCFLSHGGSSETFTVNEGLPVNSVIGSIKVSDHSFRQLLVHRVISY